MCGLFFPCLLGGGSGVDKVKVICEHSALWACTWVSSHIIVHSEIYSIFQRSLLPSPHKKHPSRYIRRCDGYRKRSRGRGGEAFFPPLTFRTRKKIWNSAHTSAEHNALLPLLPTHHHRRLPKPEGTQNLLFRTSAQKYSSHTARKKRGRNYPSIPAPSLPAPKQQQARTYFGSPPKKNSGGLCRKPSRYYTYRGTTGSNCKKYIMGKVYDVQICIFISDLATTLPFPSLPFPFREKSDSYFF